MNRSKFMKLILNFPSLDGGWEKTYFVSFPILSVISLEQNVKLQLEEGSCFLKWLKSFHDLQNRHFFFFSFSFLGFKFPLKFCFSVQNFCSENTIYFSDPRNIFFNLNFQLVSSLSTSVWKGISIVAIKLLYHIHSGKTAIL